MEWTEKRGRGRRAGLKRRGVIAPSGRGAHGGGGALRGGAMTRGCVFGQQDQDTWCSRRAEILVGRAGGGMGYTGRKILRGVA